jgi:sugar phosphate isomerase/epimerase
MQIGISQISIPGPTLFKRLHWARKYGFAAVELLCYPVPAERLGLHVPELQFSEIKALKGELEGFESLSLHAPFQGVFDTSLVSVNPRIREASIQDVALTVRLAEALGARLVTCHTGWTASGAAPAAVRDNLCDSLSRLSQETGSVRIGVEVADWFMPMDRFELLRDLALPGIGITLDIGHAHFDVGGYPSYRAYKTVGGFIRAFGDLIYGVHVHDYDGEHDHIALGQGRIDFAGIVDALRETSYAGDLTLELHPDLCGPEGVLYSRQHLESLLGESEVDV